MFRNVIAVNTFRSKIHESNVFFLKKLFLIFTYQNDLKVQRKIISRNFFLKITKYCFNRKNKQPFIFAIKKCFWRFFIFLLKLLYFYIFGLFWCADVKNNFLKKIKNIILIHFQIKNTWKNNHYHNHKSQTLP